MSDKIEWEALDQIETYLTIHSKLLKNFLNMLLPSERILNFDHNDEYLDQLIQKERLYNITQLEDKLRQNFPLLNKDQHTIYNVIIQATEDEDGSFFVDGLGGTEKTFLYNILLAYIRSLGEIAVVVTSFEIAAILITGNYTTHSRFKILLKLNKSSMCNISRRSKEAYLINKMKLFIWDKIPITYKFAFEAVDHILCDIVQIDKPFGEKVFVFGDDFCQVLSILPYGSCADIVSASLC